ncbi:MAG: type 2 lantipeptide synthetase LanM [Gammaproteobacteria bacterium]|nr:type 2 lantipeptide synthetase LanM [Gammaproteobacteria bacterium]
MVTHQKLIHDIVANASSIADRITYGFKPLTRGAPSLLKKWREMVASDRPDRFERRLGWFHTNEEEVLPLLGPVALSEDYPLPGWAHLLGEWIDRRNETGALEHLDQEAVRQVPFWQLLGPLVAVSSEALANQLGHLKDKRISTVWPHMQLALFEMLGRLAARALYVEFNVARSLAKQESPGVWLSPEAAKRSTAFFDNYMQELCADEEATVLKRYPVMARNCCLVAENWVHTLGEFTQRLDREFHALEDTFGGPLGTLTGMDFYLSDMHNGGRTALALEFANGIELIYKPKDLSSEENFQKLLRWCEDKGLAFDFHRMNLLPCRGHGWVEKVPSRPCANTEDAERFFHRAGGLLCLLYLLEATDCHRENIIANGEHPVLVDLETLFHNRDRSKKFETVPMISQKNAWKDVNHSVLATGLLPSWQIHVSGQVFDISGLAGGFEEENHDFIPTIHDVNTDGMELGKRAAVEPNFSHRCRLQDHVLSPSDYVRQIVQGFEEVHRCVRAHKEELLAPAGLLAHMADQQVRIILRDTRTYAGVLRQALYPRNLKNGAEFSIYMDLLARGYLDDAPDEMNETLDYEVSALHGLDIPVFTTRADSTDLVTGDGRTMRDFYRTPAGSIVKEHIHNQAEKDCIRQTGYIRGALFTNIARTAEAGGSSARTEALAPSSGAMLNTQEALRIASDLLASLETYAIYSDEGYPGWIGLAALMGTQEYQLRPMGVSHFEGLTGVALFLSALYKVQGDPRHLRFANSILAGVIRDLNDPYYLEELRSLGIGAWQGISSCLYGLVKCAELLDASQYTEEALKLANEITPELIASDEVVDAMFGSAGAIHALSALLDTTGESELENKIALCANQIMARSFQPSQGQRAWHTIVPKTPLCGYSHGASGIAHALLKAGRLLGRRELIQAARESFAFENAQFNATAGGWPDYRYPAGENGNIYQTNWCNGSAGIGLSRIAASEYLDDSLIAEDIYRALQHSLSHESMSSDILCCGYLGRVELWLNAGQTGFYEEGETKALQLLDAMCKKAQTRGFRIGWENAPYNPALFQGVSGVGYELVRAVSPEKIPCIALWK